MRLRLSQSQVTSSKSQEGDRKDFKSIDKGRTECVLFFADCKSCQSKFTANLQKSSTSIENRTSKVE